MEGNYHSVLVWGPPCSGKTINRDAIKEYFGCDEVVDDPLRDGFELGGIRSGRVLVLASSRQISIERQGESRREFEPDLAYPIATVKGLLGGKWIEPVANYEPPRKSDFDRFFDLLESYPRLKGYWNRERRECDVDSAKRDFGVLSSGEWTILQCLVSIWMGGLGPSSKAFKLDFTALASIGVDALQPLIEWLAEPCWP